MERSWGRCGPWRAGRRSFAGRGRAQVWRGSAAVWSQGSRPARIRDGATPSGRRQQSGGVWRCRGPWLGRVTAAGRRWWEASCAASCARGGQGESGEGKGRGQGVRMRGTEGGGQGGRGDGGLRQVVPYNAVSQARTGPDKYGNRPDRYGNRPDRLDRGRSQPCWSGPVRPRPS